MFVSAVRERRWGAANSSARPLFHPAHDGSRWLRHPAPGANEQLAGVPRDSDKPFPLFVLCRINWIFFFFILPQLNYLLQLQLKSRKSDNKIWVHLNAWFYQYYKNNFQHCKKKSEMILCILSLLMFITLFFL